MLNMASISWRRIGLALAILIAFVAWLGVHWPHNGLWYDEALTHYVATHSWQTLWDWCTRVDIQVPFHYVVLRLWTMLVGDSEFTLRLLSALSMLLAVAGTLALGRRFMKGLGPVAAILLGSMPGVLWVAYEVRAYSLALALYVWATVFLFALLDDRVRHRRWLLTGYVLLMLATLYTHYTAIAGFAAHVAIVTLLAIRRRSLFRTLLPILLLVGLGFAPWLPVLLTRSTADRSYYTGAPIFPDRAVGVAIGFKLLGQDVVSDAMIPLMIGYALLIVLGVVMGWRRWRVVLTGVVIAAFPLVLTAAVVYFKPKLAGRYTWPAWIGLDLLAGLAVLLLARRWRWVGAIALIGIVAAPWLSDLRGQPPDSDFRGAYAYLCTIGAPGDMVALRNGMLYVVDDYYGARSPCSTPGSRLRLPDTLMVDIDVTLQLSDAQAAIQKIETEHPKNVWVISWDGDVMDPQALTYGLLDGLGTHTVVGKMFGDVRLDRYQIDSPANVELPGTLQPMAVTPVPNGPTLQGVRLFAPEVARAGDTVVLQAWWTRGAVLLPDLRVSARITTLDNGWIYTQVDQPPSGWKYIDDRWRQGVPVLGRYELRINSDVPAGKVAVRYLLYDVNQRWAPIVLDVGEIAVQK